MQRLARLSRLRPAPLETARHAARLSHAGAGPETIRVQRVRFMKPRRGPFRKSVGIALFCFAVYVSGIVSVEVVEEEEDDDDEYEEHDQWSNSNEEEKEPLVRFFPFPFTEELVHHPPYPLGSPERAAYRQLWKDPKKLNDIRVSLSWLVYRAYESNRQLASAFGKPRSWNSNIHLGCPPSPPPEWTQRGIAIRDGEISWAMMRPVDPHVINMLHKILWPAPVAHALWQYTKTVVVQGYQKILGPDESPGQPTQPAGGLVLAQDPNERQRQIALALRRQISGGPAAGTGSGPSAADRSRDGFPPITPSATSGNAYPASSETETSRKADLGTPAPTVIDLARAPSSVVRGLFPTAWDQLMFNIRNVWRREVQLPPRGCVVAFGTVDVTTAKGIAVFHVDAHYNMKKSEFDRPSLRVSFKGFVPGSRHAHVTGRPFDEWAHLDEAVKLRRAVKPRCCDTQA